MTSALLLGACSQDSQESTATFGPASTLVPARTVPENAVEFCNQRVNTLAVGDLFDQLQEPLQLLVEKRYADAIEPSGALFDALDTATGVLEDIKSTAPPQISADVAIVTDHTLNGFEMLPDRDEFIQALESEDERRVVVVLDQFETGIAFLSEPQTNVDEAATRMRDFIAETC
jgi:hypothetical protein